MGKLLEEPGLPGRLRASIDRVDDCDDQSGNVSDVWPEEWMSPEDADVGRNLGAQGVHRTGLRRAEVDDEATRSQPRHVASHRGTIGSLILEANCEQGDIRSRQQASSVWRQSREHD